MPAGPLQRKDNHKHAEIGWSHLKVFSRTTGPEKLNMMIAIKNIHSAKK
jgi:hypothetical protein